MTRSVILFIVAVLVVLVCEPARWLSVLALAGGLAVAAGVLLDVASWLLGRRGTP